MEIRWIGICIGPAGQMPAHVGSRVMTAQGGRHGPGDHRDVEALMTRRLISSGSTFEQEIGYSRAVVDGEWVFVSGTTGFNYATMTISDDLAEQTDQCLRNIQAALAEAGASLADVVRVTYVLPNADEFRACWPILRRYFGEVRPAAMMISAGLADPRMRIEIEVTARIGSGSHEG
jgi:enamine deaminase RidA (YjgF/YER057c/UK114 family)